MTYRWIISAAHCFEEPRHRKDLEVVAGSTRIGQHQYFPRHHQARNVKQIIMHEDYDTDTCEHDIALVKVVRPFFHTARVTLVKLPTVPKEVKNLIVNESVSIAGWGKLRYKGETTNRLMKINVRVITQEMCNLDYYPLEQPEDLFYCAKADDVVSCQGDSGGPVMHKDLQIGVVSYGRECAPEYGGVYTRVDTHVDWLNSRSLGHRQEVYFHCFFLWMCIFIFKMV